MTRFVLSDQTIPLFSSSGVGSVGGGGAAAGASSSPAFDRRESGFSSSNYGTVNSISGLSGAGGGRERRGNRYDDEKNSFKAISIETLFFLFSPQKDEPDGHGFLDESQPDGQRRFKV